MRPDHMSKSRSPNSNIILYRFAVLFVNHMFYAEPLQWLLLVCGLKHCCACMPLAPLVPLVIASHNNTKTI